MKQCDCLGEPPATKRWSSSNVDAVAFKDPALKDELIEAGCGRMEGYRWGYDNLASNISVYLPKTWLRQL